MMASHCWRRWASSSASQQEGGTVTGIHALIWRQAKLPSSRQGLRSALRRHSAPHDHPQHVPRTIGALWPMKGCTCMHARGIMHSTSMRAARARGSQGPHPAALTFCKSSKVSTCSLGTRQRRISSTLGAIICRTFKACRSGGAGGGGGGGGGGGSSMRRRGVGLGRRCAPRAWPAVRCLAGCSAWPGYMVHVQHSHSSNNRCLQGALSALVSYNGIANQRSLVPRRAGARAASTTLPRRACTTLHR